MSRFSFTKADRLLKRKAFTRLGKTGTAIRNRHFLLIYTPGRSARSRLGITVTRKVGPAVARNRIKRYSREYFRRNRHSLAGIWDINLIAKKEAALLTSTEAFHSLEDIFGKIAR